MTTPTSLEERGRNEEERVALERMKEAGAPTEHVEFVDFFGGFDEVQRWTLPGQGKVPEHRRAYLEVLPMTEGMRQTFQKRTNSKVTILHENRNAEMGVDPARDRRELIKISVQGWGNFFRRDPSGALNEVKYTDRAFQDFFEKANPKLVDELEKFIRSINPWMLDEMNEEAITQEIERLEKLRQDVRDREAEKNSFQETSS